MRCHLLPPILFAPFRSQFQSIGAWTQVTLHRLRHVSLPHGTATQRHVRPDGIYWRRHFDDSDG